MGPEGETKRDPPRSGRGRPFIILPFLRTTREARLHRSYQRAAFLVKQEAAFLLHWADNAEESVEGQGLMSVMRQ